MNSNNVAYAGTRSSDGGRRRISASDFTPGGSFIQGLRSSLSPQLQEIDWELRNEFSIICKWGSGCRPTFSFSRSDRRASGTSRPAIGKRLIVGSAAHKNLLQIPWFGRRFRTRREVLQPFTDCMFGTALLRNSRDKPYR